MARLEELTRGAAVQGVLPEAVVTVVDVKWHGSAVVELTYKESSGRLGSELLYRDREPSLSVVTAGRPWSFDGDGALLRLVWEAMRIRGAHLFAPLLAVHTSLGDPLPHQITAVYGEMLPALCSSPLPARAGLWGHERELQTRGASGSRLRPGLRPSVLA